MKRKARHPPIAHDCTNITRLRKTGPGAGDTYQETSYSTEVDMKAVHRRANACVSMYE
jgi:hypothetical protein